MELYAIRDLRTGKLVSKRQGNPFYVRRGMAEGVLQYQKLYGDRRYPYHNEFELVIFELVEKEVEE